MTLHPIPLDFLLYEENFIFFFISVDVIINNMAAFGLFFTVS
jgi:hypothetical protein